MNVFDQIAHGLHINWIYLSALFAAAVLMLAGLTVRRAVAGENGGVLPDEGVTIRNVIEVLVETLGDLGQTTIGDEWRRYFPVVGTIFFFVLVSNFMSLIPGLLGSTGDANVTFAWGIVSFVVYNYVGIKQHGWKYIYQFMGPAMGSSHTSASWRRSSCRSRSSFISPASSRSACVSSRTCSRTIR